MGSLLGSVDESFLKQVNEPEKTKIQYRDVDKLENNQIGVLDSTKNPIEQSDKFETQIDFISIDARPSKRQRKQHISERKVFEEEKEKPIVTELKSDTSLPAIAPKNYQKYQYQCGECGENFDGESFEDVNEMSFYELLISDSPVQTEMRDHRCYCYA